VLQETVPDIKITMILLPTNGNKGRGILLRRMLIDVVSYGTREDIINYIWVILY